MFQKKSETARSPSRGCTKREFWLFCLSHWTGSLLQKEHPPPTPRVRFGELPETFLSTGASHGSRKRQGTERGRSDPPQVPRHTKLFNPHPTFTTDSSGPTNRPVEVTVFPKCLLGLVSSTLWRWRGYMVEVQEWLSSVTAGSHSSGS